MRNFSYKTILVFALVMMAPIIARADITEYDPTKEYTLTEQQQIISTLENDNRLLDAEIDKCERKKKGWLAATIIGATGVVATGVAAGVQGKKLSDQKTELNQKQNELNRLETEKNNLK